MGAGSDRGVQKRAEGARAMSGAALTIEMLRRGVDALGPAEWQQVKARCAWVTQQVAAWDEAMRAMGERCMAAVETMSEDAFDRLRRSTILSKTPGLALSIVLRSRSPCCRRAASKQALPNA